MKKFFLYFCITISSLFVFFAVGLFLALSFLDLNNYRDDIISLASDSLGKDVRVHGDFDLQFSLQPSLELSCIEVKDPAQSGETIIVADSFYIKASLWSLFGRPVIEKFTLHDAKIHLHKKPNQNEHDYKTYKTECLSRNSLSDFPISKSTEGGGGNPLSNFPIFKSVDVKNVRIYILKPEAKINFEVPIEAISVVENKVNVNIADMKNNRKSYGNFLATGHIDNDSIIIDSLKQGDAISGELAYSHKSNIRGDIQINGFPMELLDILTGNMLKFTGKLDGSINLHATGKNKKDLMESLKGNIELKSHQFIVRKDSFILWLLNLANLSTNTWGSLFLEAPIENGIATITGVSALNIGDIRSNGTVDFTTESIDITNHMEIDLPLFKVCRYVSITGGLTDPEISNFSDCNTE